MNGGFEALADTVSTAAERLGISRSRIYIEIKEGRLRARKMGSRTLITREEQQRWLNALPEIAA